MENTTDTKMMRMKAFKKEERKGGTERERKQASREEV